MNVVALAKIVALANLVSILICFVNYEMFLIMQLNLTCGSFQITSNDSSKEELESSRVKDTMAKERASEEYKENGRFTSRDEDHLRHKK